MTPSLKMITNLQRQGPLLWIHKLTPENHSIFKQLKIKDQVSWIWSNLKGQIAKSQNKTYLVWMFWKILCERVTDLLLIWKSFNNRTRLAKENHHKMWRHILVSILIIITPLKTTRAQWLMTNLILTLSGLRLKQG